MSTALSYPKDDRAYVMERLDFTPSPLPSAGWVGMIPENSRFATEPRPTGNPRNPTMMAVWRLTYDSLEGDFEGSSAPVRRGTLRVEIITELGAGQGGILELRDAILARLDDNSADPQLYFDVQKSNLAGATATDPWFRQSLLVPFLAG